MEIRYFKHYSTQLGCDMEFKAYGHAGKPVMFIPTEGGRFYDFEDFRMLDHWTQWIEEGRCTVYAIDSIDGETYLSQQEAPGRIRRHEQWYNYIIYELVPYIRMLSLERNGYDQGIMTFGCSMGAMHAANLFFRRPDLFNGVFAISGLYDSQWAFGDYMDDLLYQNCPVNYLANMPSDHHYIDMYNHRKMVIVVGQGAWEDDLKASTGRLQEVLRNKGIHAQVDFWGHDVNHDWPWWFKMVEYYAPQFLY